LEHQHAIAVALEHKIQAAANKAVSNMKKKDKYLLSKVVSRNSAILERREVKHAGAAIVTHANIKAKADSKASNALTHIVKLDSAAKKLHSQMNEVVKLNSKAQH